MRLVLVIRVPATGVGEDVFHTQSIRVLDGVGVQLVDAGSLLRFGMDDVGPHVQGVELDVELLTQRLDLADVTNRRTRRR